MIGAFLSGAWSLLTETTIPGVGFSYAALFVGLVVISIGFKFLSYVLGFGFGGIDGSDARLTSMPRLGSKRERYGSGSGGKVKISDARKHDER